MALMSRLIPSAAVWACAAFAAGTGTGPLKKVVDASSAIAAADIVACKSVSAQHTVDLIVRAPIKGNLSAGTYLTARYDARPVQGGAVEGCSEERGLFFLRSRDGGWSLIPVDGGALGLSGAYFPLPGVGTAMEIPQGETPIDRAVNAMLQSLEASPAAAGLQSRFRALVSPKAFQPAYRRLSGNRSSRLSRIGLAGLISSGDREAVRAGAKQVREANAGADDSELVASSLAGLRSSDAEVVQAIGRYAVTCGRPAEVRSMAYALYAVHTREALPYLYELLSSSDPQVRELAVMGFSGFVTGMRVSADGADMNEALDEVMNPGRRSGPATAYDTEQTRHYVHFGPFPNEQVAGEYVNFWKAWFESNRAAL